MTETETLFRISLGLTILFAIATFAGANFLIPLAIAFFITLVLALRMELQWKRKR